jgi:hypothetical protein
MVLHIRSSIFMDYSSGGVVETIDIFVEADRVS